MQHLHNYNVSGYCAHLAQISFDVLWNTIFNHLNQAFGQSLYFSQTCNLQAEFVYILPAQSRQTNSACRLQVWLKFEDGKNAWSQPCSMPTWIKYQAFGKKVFSLISVTLYHSLSKLFPTMFFLQGWTFFVALFLRWHHLSHRICVSTYIFRLLNVRKF